MKPEKPPQRDANQGEGDRISARHYNDHLRQFVNEGKVDPAAHDAEAYVDQQPEDAARAERKASRGPQRTKVSLDELVAMVHSIVERLRPIAVRVVGKLRARLHRK